MATARLGWCASVRIATTEGMCGDLGNVPTARWHTRPPAAKSAGGGTRPPQPTVGGMLTMAAATGECRRRKEGRGGDIRAGAIIRDRESSAVCSWLPPLVVDCPPLFDNRPAIIAASHRTSLMDEDMEDENNA